MTDEQLAEIRNRGFGSHSDVLALLAEVDRLRAEVAWLEKKCDESQDLLNEFGPYWATTGQPEDRCQRTP